MVAFNGEIALKEGDAKFPPRLTADLTKARDEFAAAMRTQGCTYPTIYATTNAECMKNNWPTFTSVNSCTAALLRYFRSLKVHITDADFDEREVNREIALQQYNLLLQELMYDFMDVNKEWEPFERGELSDKISNVLERITDLQGLTDPALFKGMINFINDDHTKFGLASEDLAKQPIESKSALLEFMRQLFDEKRNGKRIILEGDAVADKVNAEFAKEEVEEGVVVDVNHPQPVSDSVLTDMVIDEIQPVIY